MLPVTLIHIGLPKTGTTSLQNHLNSPSNLLDGVHYCHYSPKPLVQSRCFANAMGLGQDSGIALSPEAYLDRISAAFENGAEVAIISDETLSQVDRIHSNRMRAFLAGLREVSDVRIVMSVRPWFSWLESLINQSLKMGNFDPVSFDAGAVDHINKYPVDFLSIHKFYNNAAGGVRRDGQIPVHFIDQSQDILTQFEAVADRELFDRTSFECRNLSPTIGKCLAMFASRQGIDAPVQDRGWQSFLSAADADQLYARHKPWIQRLSKLIATPGLVDDYESFRPRADQTGALSYARELMTQPVR